MKGFTLVETIIVVGIMAFAMGALTLLYLNFNTVLGTGGALKAVAADAGRVMNEAETLILPASAVLSSHSFSGTNYSSGASTLVLELPSIDGTGAVLAGEYDYAVIYQAGSTTMRILAPDSSSARTSGTKKLASTVSTLTFTYDSGDFTAVSKVDVDVQTVTVSKGKATSGRLREQIYLRNHE